MDANVPRPIFDSHPFHTARFQSTTQPCMSPIQYPYQRIDSFSHLHITQTVGLLMCYNKKRFDENKRYISIRIKLPY